MFIVQIYCHEFVKSWSTTLQTYLLDSTNDIISQYLVTLNELNVPLQSILQDKIQSNYSHIFCSMLFALHQCSVASASFASAGQAMIEVAIISFISEHVSMPICELLGIDAADSTTPTFYTASLNDDINVTIESATFGRRITRNIKIKLNGNVEQTENILKTLYHWCNNNADNDNEMKKEQQQEEEKQEKQEKPLQWCVDANCAWTPTLALEMLNILKPYKDIICMVEQPFPVKTTHGTNVATNEGQKIVDEWCYVKKMYNSEGLPIFADESMRNVSDINSLIPLVNGINIKLEKCGGYIGALKIAQMARKVKLDLWIGCMVGSTLNGNGAAQLAGMKGIVGSDLDGSALVTDECQSWLKGGFQFINSGITVSKERYGLNLQVV